MNARFCLLRTSVQRGRCDRVAWSARVAGVALLSTVLISANCQTNINLPLPPGGSGGPPAAQGNPGAGNVAPVLTFTWPATNITIQDGTIVVIQFTVTGSNPTRVSLVADPTTDPNNGDEIVLATGIQTTPPSFAGSFSWNTVNFPPANYVVRGVADDSVNALARANAAGIVTILPRPGSPPGGGGGPPPPAPNERPLIFITAPAQDLVIDAGQVVRVEFTRIDRDSNTTITFVADPDGVNGNGNEVPIFGPQQFAPGVSTESFFWDTTGRAAGEYRIVATVTDDTVPANGPVVAQANGVVRILSGGTGVPSQPPFVFPDSFVANGVVRPGNPPIIEAINQPGLPPAQIITLPQPDRGVRNGDEVEVLMVLRNLEVVETLEVRVFIDFDRNSSNDDGPTYFGNPADPARPQQLIPVGGFSIPGNGYTGGIAFQPFPTLSDFFFFPFRFRIDTSIIPIRTDRDAAGRPLPYTIRIMADDGHTDGTGRRDHLVSAYSAVNLYVQGLATGAVDLRDVGSIVSGARFQGFYAGDYMGSGFAALGDAFQEVTATQPADDFAIIARYATLRNFSRPNVGAAFVIPGRSNSVDRGRFAGVISSAAIGQEFAGTIIGGNRPSILTPFQNPLGISGSSPPASLVDPRHLNVFWSGITSLTRIADVTGDQLPDFVVGVPFISGLYDSYDDDPCDQDLICPIDTPYYYSDTAALAQGRPLSDSLPDDLGFLWTNPITGVTSPIDQGYAFVIDGTSLASQSFIDLRWVGQQPGQTDRTLAVDDEGATVPSLITPLPAGIRLRGGGFLTSPQDDPPVRSQNEFGRTVAATPSLNGIFGIDDLIISAPGTRLERGAVHVLFGRDGFGRAWTDTNVTVEDEAAGLRNLSLPNILGRGVDCVPICGLGQRGQRTLPAFDFVNVVTPYLPERLFVVGAAPGDRLGFGGTAGDFRRIGRNDLLCGAPGADSLGLSNNGKVYILFNPAGGWSGPIVLPVGPTPNDGVPRIELLGTHTNDNFGGIQKLVGDMNGDLIPDIAFAASLFDDDLTVPGEVSVDAGFVGVLFGNPPATGEVAFRVTDVGTANLPGVKFVGAVAGALAGATIDAAGDFNRDGYADLLIAAPGEVRIVPTEVGGVTVNQARLGVAYLVFGGPHLVNKTFNLSQVDSPELPGIVFISAYVQGSLDEAPTEVVAGIGDIDGDGFDDIGIGAPRAPLLFPGNPGQRRDNVGDAYIIYGSNFGRNRVP